MSGRSNQVDLWRMVRSIGTAAVLACGLGGIVQNAAAIDVSPKCVAREDHSRVTYFLIDRSDKLANEEAFAHTFRSLRELMKDGERLIIGLSTENAAATRVVMDLVRPEKSLWVSQIKQRAQQKRFDTCIDEIEKALASEPEEHKLSPVLETMAFVSKVLQSEAAPEKTLVLYSDMLQNSEALSFYKTSLTNPDTAVALVKKQGLMPAFPGVKVYVAGAPGSSDKRGREVEQFWTKLFKESGAEVKFYGPLLVGG